MKKTLHLTSRTGVFAGMTTHHLGSTTRSACFDSDFKKAPGLRFAVVEPDTAGGEDGASVLVGEGLALGAASVGFVHDLVALDAKTGAVKWRHTPSKKQCWPTSHFALADGTVYVATNQGLHALDAKTGEPRWLAKLSGATGAPVVLDGVVVIGAKKGLFALDLAKKGRKKWSFALKTAVGGAVAALDDTLYFVADSALFALSAADQDVAWKTPASEYCRIGPVVDATQVYYLLDVDTVGCVDRATGKVKWKRKLPCALMSGGFALGGGLLVAKDQEGGLHALDTKTGKLKWTQAPGADAFGKGGLIISGASVIAVREDGGETTLCAWDLATGKRRWALDSKPVVKALAAAQKKAGSAHECAWNMHTTPFVADGLLYAQTDAGIVALKP